MVAAVILPNPKAAFITSAGLPAVGYKIKTYDAGTLTPRATYLDSGKAGNNTNPIILDARGEAVIYWDGAYKVILTDPNDVVIWTVDNVTGNIWDITQTQNANSFIQMFNDSTGAAAASLLIAKNHNGSVCEIIELGSNYTTAGILRQDGGVLFSNGAGGLTLATGAAQPIYLAIANTGIGGFNNGNGNRTLDLTNNGNATPSGIFLTYTAAAPNGTGNEFASWTDTVGQKTAVRSNGGLANFSANNVNLSDIRVKPEFQKHTDADLAALETSFIAVDWARFKYVDQTHDDWNYGYSAQGVEAAFALTVPAMTDIWNPETVVQIDDGAGNLVAQKIPTPVKDQLRAVYTEDLHNIAHALLARALKRIATLEARLATAGIP